MGSAARIALEVWSPLPPLPSGVADYVAEQLEVLGQEFALTLVVEEPSGIDPRLRAAFRVVSPAESDPTVLRVYHVGNSPLHGFIYQEALRVPGVVVLHEWNLHELVLGFAVRSNDFDAYYATMRREHGEHGSIAARTIATALGGRFWTGLFPLNAEILENALAVACLARGTAARVRKRAPAIPVLHLPHHAVLTSSAVTREEARHRLGLPEKARIVLAPGLGTASKALDMVRVAVAELKSGNDDEVMLITAGGEVGAEGSHAQNMLERALGRVDLAALGDALLAADVVVALRFPSRGEASGVVMRALAAGRALVVSAGSTADEDLPQGVMARVNPGPGEARELAAILRFLLGDEAARTRLELLARAEAKSLQAEPLTHRFAEFIQDVGAKRAELDARRQAARPRWTNVRERFRADIEAAAASLELFHLPRNVFEKLEGL